MATKTKVVGLKPKRMAAQMFRDLCKVQTDNLIAYAQKKCQEIGNYIQTAPTINHMDRTGNLLNSLCWGVSFRGKLVDSGFYRPAKTNKKRASGWNADGSRKYTDVAEMHEWSPTLSGLQPVNGRRLASEYVKSYGNNGARGWRVFWAILAPYWTYWENGFRFESKHGKGFLQFSVMTYFYDQIRPELKPARTRFRHPVAKYDMAKLEQKAMR